jgi:hypothetical protein
MTIRRQSQTLLASAARTTAQTSAEFSAEEVLSSDFVFDVTLDPGTASITPSIQGKDPISGSFYTILTGAAVAATGTTVMRVGPTIIAAANVAANAMLPAVFRVAVAVADAESMTYSFSVSHMVQN